MRSLVGGYPLQLCGGSLPWADTYHARRMEYYPDRYHEREVMLDAKSRKRAIVVPILINQRHCLTKYM